jgi:hypothetical protein
MSKSKIGPNPKLDAETLVVGLSSFFTTESRTKMFSLAREMTRRNITDDELMREMLEAMKLLERTFPPNQ